MSRYVKTQVTQLSANEQAAIDSINKNFQDIQEAIADTVSRSGNVPTHMTADFDLNGKRIINTSAPKTDNDFVRRVDVLGDIATVQSLVNATTNAAAQTLQAAQEVQEIIQDKNVGLVADDLALGDDSKIKQVAENKDNIDLVASLDDDIEAVVALKDDIPVVVQVAEDIDKVEDIAEDITAVADNAANITAVAENEENINAVNANKTNINAAVSNATNINAVAGNQTNIDAVAGNAKNINSVAGNSKNINAVAGNATNINAVAGNESDIDTVAGIASDVSTVASNSSNVSNVATNMSDVNNCATNMSAIQDAPNQAQAAADSAALSAQYANDKINQTHISNCITEIPQDIKIEPVSNGRLMIKNGSKIYIPNGIGVFDVYNFTTNYVIPTFVSDFTKKMLFFKGTSLYVANQENCFSGSTQPSGYSSMYWYDTTNNVIKHTSDSGSTWVSGYPFPLAIISQTNNTLSIDQVFNGFGYIGSTVFALPGVKGLIPNGRNSDGTLKNTTSVLSSVSIYTPSPIANNYRYSLAFRGASSIFYNNLVYNEEENKNYAGGTYSSWLDAGYLYFSDNKISELKVKTVFHALDYNDKGTIAGLGMPSNRYIDLTLGASGSTYTAPANGYFNLRGYGYSVEIYRGHMHVCCMYPQTEWGAVIMPVSKGQEIEILYNLTGDKNLRFYYSQGEQ